MVGEHLACEECAGHLRKHREEHFGLVGISYMLGIPCEFEKLSYYGVIDLARHKEIKKP